MKKFEIKGVTKMVGDIFRGFVEIKGEKTVYIYYINNKQLITGDFIVNKTTENLDAETDEAIKKELYKLSLKEYAREIYHLIDNDISNAVHHKLFSPHDISLLVNKNNAIINNFFIQQNKFSEEDMNYIHEEVNNFLRKETEEYLQKEDAFEELKDLLEELSSEMKKRGLK